MSDVSDAAAIGASAALLGAAVAGGTQLLLARQQWKRQQSASSRERRRALYAEYLVFLTSLRSMVRDSWRQGEAGLPSDLGKRIDEFQGRFALDAPAAVRERVDEVSEAVAAFLKQWLASWDEDLKLPREERKGGDALLVPAFNDTMIPMTDALATAMKADIGTDC